MTNIRVEESAHWEHATPTRISQDSVKRITEMIRQKVGNAGIGLEVGCGDGQYTMHLPNAIGVDFSFKLLKELSGFKRVTGNAMNLPFKSNKFDYVFINSLHHMDEKVVISELIRVLKPGMPLFLLEPNMLHPIRYFCMRNSLLFPEHSPDEKAFNPYKLKELINRSGAIVISIEFLSVRMVPKSWRGRLQDILECINTSWSHSWFFMEAKKNEDG